MNTTMRMILGLSLCWLAACADVPEASPEAGQEAQPSMLVDPAAVGLPAAAQPQAPVLPVPENVQVDGTYLFSMETEPEIVELTLHGTVKDRLAGRLADDEGRRKIVYYGPDYRAPQTLFAADWLLPAVGAVNKAGEMLVCVNRLVGAPSVLTKGNVPDPANGVDLVCRWRSGRGWSREFKAPRRSAALWLTDVLAMRDGTFRIVYAEDATGLMVDDASRDEGIFRLIFDRGRFGEPERARRFPQPE